MYEGSNTSGWPNRKFALHRMDFEPGSYAQIKIPAFQIDYDKDFDKSLIGDTYLPAWEKFGLFGLKCVNDTPTIHSLHTRTYAYPS